MCLLLLRTRAATNLQLMKVLLFQERKPLSKLMCLLVVADIKHCAGEIIYQASSPVLVEAALQNEKGSYLTSSGALSVRSGAKTGRSPKDKRLVAEPESEQNVWWGPVNIKLNTQSYMINRERAIDYLNTRERIYVVDGYAGWDPAYRVRVRVICVRVSSAASSAAHLQLFAPARDRARKLASQAHITHSSCATCL